MLFELRLSGEEEDEEKYIEEDQEPETICRDCFVTNPSGKNLNIKLKGNWEGISVSEMRALAD